MSLTGSLVPSASTPAVTVSKDTIRARAIRFAADWADATSEQADRQTFWNEFFDVFGVSRRRVATFERRATKATTGGIGWIDMLFSGHLGVEHKTAGADLDAALDQLHAYLPGLPSAEHPWLLVACDFARFRWENLDAGTSGEFALADLPDHLDLFWWLAGYQNPNVTYADETAANLAATDLLTVVHDHLARVGYDPHHLREWMTRILFCLFADDAGVWDRGAFHTYLANHTNPDGSDLGAVIATVFQILNTPPGQRVGVGGELTEFTYVNGDLFAEPLPIPFCDADTRDALLEACTFDWSIVSPAIFGSMFQNVMDPTDRRQLGAHYTSRVNIERVIRPLFLDDLEDELAAATSKPKLRAFLDRLPDLTFLDPACGCGNFLVVTYEHLRRLETEALERLADKEGRSGQLGLDVTLDCKVRVDQFHGIELEEFPALIARTALYLADHLANRDASVRFGQHLLRFPIPASPHIHQANALTLAWADVLDPADCDVILGNPPFVGRPSRTADQTADLKAVWGDRYHGNLDFVTGWFAKAAAYDTHHRIRIGFVATNSITQGNPVAPLWGPLLDDGYEIDFAYRTFPWANDAAGMAHVHVVIIGYSHTSRPATPKRLYPKPDLPPVAVDNITPYLTRGATVLVLSRQHPLAGWVPEMATGSQPTDGGHLSNISPTEAAEIRATDPIAAKYLRPLLGARELLQGQERWCLWLPDAPPQDLRGSPVIRKRAEAVRSMRLASKKAPTRQAAATPARFADPRQPTDRYLAVPQTSSENRAVIPAAFLEPNVIAMNKLFTISGADLVVFGYIESAMFTAWVHAVSGRLESRFEIAPGTVYNTFPFPTPTADQRASIETAAQAVLDARDAHPDATLADLYDPLATPKDLLDAHRALDRAVDATFGKTRWAPDDADRQAVLFAAYRDLTAGRVAA